MYESIRALFGSSEPERPPEEEIAICAAEICRRLAIPIDPPALPPPDIPESVMLVLSVVVIVTLPDEPSTSFSKLTVALLTVAVIWIGKLLIRAPMYVANCSFVNVELLSPDEPRAA